MSRIEKSIDQHPLSGDLPVDLHTSKDTIPSEEEFEKVPSIELRDFIKSLYGPLLPEQPFPLQTRANTIAFYSQPGYDRVTAERLFNYVTGGRHIARVRMGKGNRGDLALDSVGVGTFGAFYWQFLNRQEDMGYARNNQYKDLKSEVRTLLGDSVFAERIIESKPTNTAVAESVVSIEESKDNNSSQNESSATLIADQKIPYIPEKELDSEIATFNSDRLRNLSQLASPYNFDTVNITRIIYNNTGRAILFCLAALRQDLDQYDPTECLIPPSQLQSVLLEFADFLDAREQGRHNFENLADIYKFLKGKAMESGYKTTRPIESPDATHVLAKPLESIEIKIDPSIEVMDSLEDLDPSDDELLRLEQESLGINNH